MIRKKEEVQKYQGLKKETERIGRIEKCDNCTFDCWCFGSITKKLDKSIGKLDVSLNAALLQKKTLLGTSMILKKVLE